MNTLASSQTTDSLVSYLFSVLREARFEDAVHVLENLIAFPNVDLPKSFLAQLKEAIISQNWRTLSKSFLDQSFIHPNGDFLFVSPFSIRRQGVTHQDLTGLYGRILNLPKIREFPITREIRKLQKTPVLPSEIIPVESFECFGFTGDSNGEAFLVPNGWRLDQSSSGPGLNDLSQQRARFLQYGIHSIETIFDEKSSNLLLEWSHSTVSAYAAQNLEFQFHELGHATGFGINEKIKNKIFITPWYAAVEEWRSDGIGIHLARQSLSSTELGHMLASHLCLRFGTDSQRKGGMELDSDVNASLLLFDRLLQNGAFHFTNDYRLSLNCDTLSELIDLFSTTCANALQLTKSEMNLSDIRGIWNLYGSVQVNPISKSLFDLFIRKPLKTLNCDLK